MKRFKEKSKQNSNGHRSFYSCEAQRPNRRAETFGEVHKREGIEAANKKYRGRKNFRRHFFKTFPPEVLSENQLRNSLFFSEM